MIAARAWQFIMGAACIACLFLPQGGVVSQANVDSIHSIAWRPDGLQFATGHGMGDV